jgi:hypothetical protein
MKGNPGMQQRKKGPLGRGVHEATQRRQLRILSRSASVEIQYTHPSPVQSEGAVPLLQKKVNRPPEIYRLEAFASTEPALAEHGVVFVKFDLAQGATGYITVQLEDSQSLTFEKGVVKNTDGQVLAVFDSTWT